MEIGSLLINPDHCSPRGFPLRVRESRRFYIYEKRFVQKGSRDKTDSKEKEKGKEKGGRRRKEPNRSRLLASVYDAICRG